jgi:predicted amidophosphoribosyltransferase
MQRRFSEIFLPRNTPGYSSTSVRAKAEGKERDELFRELMDRGYLEQWKNHKYFLTAKGFESGGRFVKEGGKVWAVWPDDSRQQFAGPSFDYDELIGSAINAINSNGIPKRIRHPLSLVLSEGDEDGYLSTTKMAEKTGGDNKIVFPLLESNGFVRKIDGVWTPTAAAVAAGAKIRPLPDGGWYPVWKPYSKLVMDTFREAWKIKKTMTKNFRYDSARKLFFLDTYVPLTSGYEQDRFSEILLGLKKRNRTSLDYFIKKLSCLRNLDFYVCTVPGHDPKKSTGIDELAQRMSEEMLCRKLTQYFRRKRKVEPQHKLSKDSKKSPSEVMKTLKITDTKKFEGKRIVLLDDITTTGNTIKGARKFIADKTDAKEVRVLVLGKTRR